MALGGALRGLEVDLPKHGSKTPRDSLASSRLHLHGQLPEMHGQAPLCDADATLRTSLTSVWRLRSSDAVTSPMVVSICRSLTVVGWLGLTIEEK